MRLYVYNDLVAEFSVPRSATHEIYSYLMYCPVCGDTVAKLLGDRHRRWIPRPFICQLCSRFTPIDDYNFSSLQVFDNWRLPIEALVVEFMFASGDIK